MGEFYETDLLTGVICKVISVDDDRCKIIVRSANDKTLMITDRENALPAKGDIIFVTETSWEAIGSTAWPNQNQIAVVKQLLDDGRVVVEANYIVSFLKNPKGLKLERGNTVEHNDTDGIVGVISAKPIQRDNPYLEAEDTSEDYLIDDSKADYSFDDFGGYADAVSRIRELIRNQIENREYLDAMKVRPIRGVLMTGPPGTGKTFLARIIAKHTGAKFFLVNGPTVVSKWLGQSESTLRQIFDAALKSEDGAIIFFDEIDSIAADRSGDTHEASKKLVAQLLTLMDGFDESAGHVIVIAATNRADTLDPAITRPGRFDWEIEFGLPNLRDRFEILVKSVARHQTANDLPISGVAAKTDGWSAAELVLIIAEAGQIAASDQRREIAAEDFAQGFERVTARLLNKAKKEKKHEAARVV
ncbi:ATP-binding protein [Qipengyuania sp. DSG2-2]|uniref:ATP-binding protein n=1 Tax=Qipengyuania sp. DGS2-2 TaxID=3349631 RepID=UPI0036D3EB07